LLLVTVVVCALALVLLARVRFPDQQPPAAEAVSPAPLERLAARASYDALAADIQRVEPMIAARLIVLRAAAPSSGDPLTLADALSASGGAPSRRHVAALRISEGIALAMVDPETRIESIVGSTPGTNASLLAVDPVRHIARVQVSSAPVRELPEVGLASLPTPAYVVAVEATQAGVTLRPVFLGRGDRFTAQRWSRPLLPLGGTAVTPGALMFTLDGGFIGLVVLETGSPAIVGARDVYEVVERLKDDPPRPVDAGIAAQRLTPTLAAALGVERGIVVTDVEPGRAADGLLEPLDVIVTVDGQPGDEPDEMLVRLGTRLSAGNTELSVVRDHQLRSITLAPGGGHATQKAAPGTPFVLERGAGARVVEPVGGVANGLLPGDIITQAGGVDAPTPAQVRKTLEQGNGGFAVFVLHRRGVQRVIAIPSGPAHAAR
jgi:hypothetical protein